MSDRGRGIIGAFRPENAAVTLHCDSFDDFRFALSSLNEVCTGNPQQVDSPTAHELLMRTCLRHELRHYHDFLVSFCGFEILRRKVQLSINAYYYFKYFDWSAVDYFPFPLHDWAFAKDAHRKEFRAWLESAYGINLARVYDPGTVPISNLNSTDASTYHKDELKILLRDAATIMGLHDDRIPERFGGLSSHDVHELGGVARQMLAMFELVGAKTAIELTRETLRDGYYGRRLNMFARLLQGMGLQDILRFQMSIATYCIAGEPPVDMDHRFSSCSPVYRLARLASLLEGKEDEVRRRVDDLDSLIAYFASLLHEAPMLERIEASNEWFTRRCEEMANNVSDGAAHRNVLADEQLLNFLSLSLELRRKFLAAIRYDSASFLEGEFEGARSSTMDVPPIFLDMTRIPPVPEPQRADPLFQPGRSLAIYWSDFVNDQRASYEAYGALEAMTSYVFFGHDPLNFRDVAAGRDNALRKMIPAKMIRYMG